MNRFLNSSPCVFLLFLLPKKTGGYACRFIGFCPGLGSVFMGSFHAVLLSSQPVREPEVVMASPFKLPEQPFHAENPKKH